MDYGHEFNNGYKLSGNFGLRYVHTTVESIGSIGLPVGTFFDSNNDGVVSVAEIDASCAATQVGQTIPGYCGLSATRKAEYARVYTGETINDSADIKYTNVLPSFNAKLDLGQGHLLRFAAAKSLSRPDLSAYATGGAVYDNTNNLRSGGTLATGPLFGIGTGNRLLRPVSSWNYDISYEWYFARVGSVTATYFRKDIDGIINSGANERRFVTPKGADTSILFNTAVNSDGGSLSGYEFTHIQVYDFLPSVLSGLGSQFSYTYVDADDFNNSNLGAEQSPFAGNTPLAGVSKHTINAVGFYEKGPLAFRLAYNWRSDFLQTPRDVIFPFSPIYGEETAQLDGSIFYSVTPKIKIGLQGVNLLDEVTQTSQQIDFSGTRVTRSAFRNDRRFTVMLRFDY